MKVIALAFLLAACGETGGTTPPAGDDAGALEVSTPEEDVGADVATPPEDEGPIGVDAPAPVDVSPECPGQHPPHTICIDGKWVCEAGWLSPMGGGPCAEATCPGLHHVKDDAIASAVSAGSACTKDVECVVVATTTACQGTCGAAINASAVAGVEAALAWVEVSVCTAYDFATKCGYSSPKCSAPSPACVEGHCVYAKPSGCAPPQPANSTCQGDHWVCDAGTFQPPGALDCEKATCAAMSDAVTQAVSAAVAAGASCGKDSDCVIVSTGTQCFGTCGEAVNVDAKAGIDTLIAGLDEHICVAFSYGEQCGYVTPMCLSPSPGCEGGACVFIKAPPGECGKTTFKPYGSSECLEATCDNMAAAKNDAIQSAVEIAKVCTSDEDCVVIDTSTSCAGTCGVAVNAGMMNDVLKIVGWVDDNICTPFDYAGKCGFATPDCLAPNPGCDGGVCVYAK